MKDIESSVNHLQWLFITVMALAVTESLKQFVRDTRDADPAPSHPIRWQCLGGLLAFLMTAIPFTFGMTRYFYEAYRRSEPGENYFTDLSLDATAFTIEALCFFVMSRSIAPDRSLTFASAALLAFSVDTAWVFKCYFKGLPSGERLHTDWMVSDPIVVSLLLVFILVRVLVPRLRNGRGNLYLHIAVCIVLIIDAVQDVPVNWSFYFPTASSRSEAAVKMRQRTIYYAGPLFTQAEWRWNAEMIEALRKEGYEVAAPQEEASEMLAGKKPFNARALFQANIAGIEKCSIVIAVLDGADADSGTAWECGYAYRIGRPVVGIRTDLRAGGDDPKASVNLMMAQACKVMVTLPLGMRDDQSLVIARIKEAIKRIER